MPFFIMYFYKYDVSKLLFVLGILLLTGLKNSRGIEGVNNEFLNSTFSSYQDSKQAGISPVLNDSEGEESSTLIVGGQPAAVGQFAYQVSIRNNRGHFCGGSIISTTKVLTAAHCLDGVSPGDIYVVVGTNFLYIGGPLGIGYAVRSIIRHEGWNPQTFVNDVAILDIVGTFTYTSTVQKISMAILPTQAPKTVVLSGWGFTSYPPGTTPNDLQFILLPTQSIPECSRDLQGQSFLVTANNVCTLKQPGQGGCRGDSGGPLVDVATGLQVGIVSWGILCALGKPDVYASVSSFHPWVLDQTGVLV